MEKAKVIFDVTEDKTQFTAVGLSGSVETIDITGTYIEKDFLRLLKKVQKFKLEKQLLEALDINTWKEV